MGAIVRSSPRSKTLSHGFTTTKRLEVTGSGLLLVVVLVVNYLTRLGISLPAVSMGTITMLEGTVALAEALKARVLVLLCTIRRGIARASVDAFTGHVI